MAAKSIQWLASWLNTKYTHNTLRKDQQYLLNFSMAIKAGYCKDKFSIWDSERVFLYFRCQIYLKNSSNWCEYKKFDLLSMSLVYENIGENKDNFSIPKRFDIVFFFLLENKTLEILHNFVYSA